MTTRSLRIAPLIASIAFFAYATPVFALPAGTSVPSSVNACEANSGTCRIGSCNDGETQNGTCDDSLTLSHTCCVKQAAGTSVPAVEKACVAAGGTCEFGACGDKEQQSGTCDDTLIQHTCCIPEKPAGGTPTGGAPVIGSTTKLFDPLQGSGLIGAISRLISTFLGVVGAIALLVFVYAGVTYMTAGSSDRVKKAIEAMKYAALGLFIIMFAYMISSLYLSALTTVPPPQTTAPAPTALPTPPPNP